MIPNKCLVMSPTGRDGPCKLRNLVLGIIPGAVLVSGKMQHSTQLLVFHNIVPFLIYCS